MVSRTVVLFGHIRIYELLKTFLLHKVVPIRSNRIFGARFSMPTHTRRYVVAIRQNAKVGIPDFLFPKVCATEIESLHIILAYFFIKTLLRNVLHGKSDCIFYLFVRYVFNFPFKKCHGQARIKIVVRYKRIKGTKLYLRGKILIRKVEICNRKFAVKIHVPKTGKSHHRRHRSTTFPASRIVFIQIVLAPLQNFH